MFLPHLQGQKDFSKGNSLHIAGNEVTSPADGVQESRRLPSPLWRRKLGLELPFHSSPQSPPQSIDEPIDDESPYFAAADTEMRLQQASSAGSAGVDTPMEGQIPRKTFENKSSSLPFGQDVPLKAVKSDAYLTALTLIQQVAYTLSDKIFAYSPETFDLDVALKHWYNQQEKNAFGFVPSVQALETRAGAGAFALGYVFSPDFDLEKRHIPQTIIASSQTLVQLRPALDQLSLLSELTNPFVTHVAAVDYAGSTLATDYVSALSVADELGLNLIASASANEVQHVALLATLLAKVGPTIHIFDGIRTPRETKVFAGALDQAAVSKSYDSISSTADFTGIKSSDVERRVSQVLKSFNEASGTNFKPFEYYGHAAAETVFVVFGTVEASLSKQIVEALAPRGTKIGVINVRLYRPFLEEEFLKILPASVKTVGVLGQVQNELAASDASEHSLLFKDCLAALSFSEKQIVVEDLKYARSEALTAEGVLAKFQQIDKTELAYEEASSAEAQHYIFWDLGESPVVNAPVVVGQLLSSTGSELVTIRTGHDHFVQGGVVRTDIRRSGDESESTYSTTRADVAFVGAQKLLGEFDVLNNLKDEASLVLTLPGVKDEDLEKKIPVGLRQGIVAKKVKLFVLDPSASSKITDDPTLQGDLTQLAYLKFAGLDLSPSTLQKLASIHGDPKTIQSLIDELDLAVRHVEVPESWATIEPEVEKVSLPTAISINGFSRYERVDPAPPTELHKWTVAAKGLAFKEAYGTTTQLRPELGIKTYVATVKERRRLTPLTYDRNIFHIEFDLGTSGVKYAIGEALGIHAENDEGEVNEFIKWYGLDPNEVVQVPSREDPDVFESRTVYQSLKQNIDIFGRPPKKFYEALAEFASDPKEQKSLQTLAIPDGATEFKRRAEVDTITYADILLEFASAHPSFHEIVRIVAPMKRREYSIASSQNVTPTSVALLIVTVNWVDPRGRDRFGQATRYLNGLKIGSPVTVSVKPSVMKLPPTTTAPLVMAGLGTGLAPFRAFVQERAYQKQQGHDIGAVMLYMGSRHQREEYLYGEEWEAYQDAGIITHIGKAFSRDQPHKIYIQDRMRQSLSEIRESYFKNEGSFYLCGPTWPVPDVTEVLQEAVEVEERSKGAKKVDSRRAIETLKEDGRFVLEVY